MYTMVKQIDGYFKDVENYVVNPMWDPRPLEGHRKFNGLILQEFDFGKGMAGESKVIFPGSPRGGCEGPHIFKKDGWYYLLTAVGGTGRHHSITVAGITAVDNFNRDSEARFLWFRQTSH